MPRRLIPAAVIAITWSLAAGALASEYRPVTCTRASAFSDLSGHPAPTAEDFAVSGLVLGTLEPSVQERLRASYLAGLKASPKVRSVTVALAAPGRGVWSATQSAPEDAPSEVFYWASAGKMFTAAVILQLIDEGRLRLDDPIAKWVPQAPNAQVITIDHLLTHTSGLFSANEDLKVRRARRALSFAEEIGVLRRHGAIFCPGERWRYSNSGYAILGRVIELVDGKSYVKSVHDRIVTPLGLTRTTILDANAPLPVMVKPVTGPGEPALDPRTPGAAGPVAASAEDMVRFLQAHLEGRATSPATSRALLERLYPSFDPGVFFGRGLMLYDVADTPRHLRLIGHAGGAPGVSALVAWSPAERAFVAVALTGDGSAAAFANTLLKTYAASEEVVP